MKNASLALSALALSLATAPSRAPAGPTVDILLLYTPAARANAGGYAGMQAALQSYVAATNTAYANSQVDLAVRLVGSSEVSYSESASFNTDLARLQNPSDGYMDEAAGLRDVRGEERLGSGPVYVRGLGGVAASGDGHYEGRQVGLQLAQHRRCGPAADRGVAARHDDHQLEFGEQARAVVRSARAVA